MTQNREWKKEAADRADWIKNILTEAGAQGVCLGISGGKDSAVVAALCKKATPNVMGIIMPCNSIPQDRQDALAVVETFNLASWTVDLTDIFNVFTGELTTKCDKELSDIASANIKPRLRMTTLYAIAQSYNYLVAGTGNASEIFVGYYTKWGDGACDFNPISDLTVEEVLELGKYLGVPDCILKKRPSAGLWPGQTDEDELGVSYKLIGDYRAGRQVPAEAAEKIRRANEVSTHKRMMPKFYAL